MTCWRTPEKVKTLTDTFALFILFSSSLFCASFTRTNEKIPHMYAMMNSSAFVTSKKFKELSNVVMIKNPGLKTSDAAAAAWGLESPINVELDLDLKGMLSTERLTWLEILHTFQVEVVFIDKTVEPLTASAPFKGASVADVAWLHFLAESTREQRELEQQLSQEQAQLQSRRRDRSRDGNNPVVTGQDPPSYQDGAEYSVLLDANPRHWQDYIQPPLYELESQVSPPVLVDEKV